MAGVGPLPTAGAAPDTRVPRDVSHGLSPATTELAHAGGRASGSSPGRGGKLSLVLMVFDPKKKGISTAVGSRGAGEDALRPPSISKTVPPRGSRTVPPVSTVAERRVPSPTLPAALRGPVPQEAEGPAAAEPPVQPRGDPQVLAAGTPLPVTVVKS